MRCPSYYTLSFILLLPFVANSQVKSKREKYWTTGFNAGIIGWAPSSLNQLSGADHFSRTMNYGIGSVTNVDGHSSLAVIANTSIGLHTGFMWKDKTKNNYTSIEAELQSNKACYEFSFPYRFGTNGDTAQNWIEADRYIKYSLALERGWNYGGNPNTFWYIRESFGQTCLHRNLGDPYSKLIRKDYSENWTENGTGMITRVTSVNPTDFMLGSEIGFKSFTSDHKSSFALGLVYYAPFTPSFTEQYEFFKQGVSSGKSTITYNGGMLLLNFRYTINYELKGRPVDTTTIKKKEPLVKMHNGRHLDIQKTIETGSDLMTVRVWDRGTVDGDKITLYLNDQVLLEGFTLDKNKKAVDLHLQPGANYLVMHADNLGSIPPNTAAMEIDDGSKKKKNFTLVSDTKKSGTIEILYKP
jgi:hypothetical protein